MQIWTIGHSNHPVECLLDLLDHHRVECVVDVRRVPRSGRYPWFNGDALEYSLEQRGFSYRHEPDLGGMRKPFPDSTNTAWPDGGMRGYADHMQSPTFSVARQRLIEALASERTVLMCAEASPWRCHRALLADGLTVSGVEVFHIVDDATPSRHRLTPFARVTGTCVRYPGLIVG